MAVVGVFLLIILLFAIGPRLYAVYSILYHDSFYHLFYVGLGRDQHEASLWSAVFSFVYAIAFISFTAFLWHLFRKFDARQCVIGLISYLAVFSLPPIAHVVHQRVGGPTLCFNQKTGEPIRWYVISSGSVELFSSPGFDPKTGQQKLAVTREICNIYDDQRANKKPNKIAHEEAVESREVWYAISNGRIETYGSAGIMPGTDELLKPLPLNMRGELKLRVGVDKKRRAEIEAATAQAARVAAQKERDRQRIVQAAEEARLKNEQTEREALAKKEQFERERAAAVRQKEQETGQRQIALQKVNENIRRSATGFECRLDLTGANLPSPAGQSTFFPYSQLRASSDVLEWGTGFMNLAQKATAVVVQLLGPQHQERAPQHCIVYSISPAPSFIGSLQKNEIESVVDALQALGSQVAQRLPPITILSPNEELARLRQAPPQRLSPGYNHVVPDNDYQSPRGHIDGGGFGRSGGSIGGGSSIGGGGFGRR